MATLCGLSHDASAPCRACDSIAAEHERIGQLFDGAEPKYEPLDAGGNRVGFMARVRLADGSLGVVYSTSADGKRANVKARGAISTTTVATDTLRLAVPATASGRRGPRRAAR